MSRVTESWGGGGFENRSEREPRPSDWIRNTSIYQLMMLRGKEHKFNVGEWLDSIGAERSGGSTLQQITSGLNRLQQLGFTTLYLTGLFQKGKVKPKGVGTPFALSDFTSIDPEWGTLEDFQFLIHTAHDLNPPVKIVVDLIFNHTAWDHRWLREQKDFYIKEQGKVLSGAFTDNRTGGAHPLIDVAQLDHSREDVREALANVLRTLVSWGIDGFRVDMAAQMMNSQYNPRWHTLKQQAMPHEEFWAEMIWAARQGGNNDVAFFAESHGEVPASELYACGFDVVTSNADDRENIGWHDALVSKSSGRIAAAIESRYRMKQTNNAAGVGFNANHDTPDPQFILGESYKAATALSVFTPPLLWVASTEGSFYYKGDRSSLDELERDKAWPLDADYPIEYDRDRNLLDWHIDRLFPERKQVFDELGRFDWRPLRGMREGGWVGVEIYSLDKPSAPTYIVIANINSHGNEVRSDFGIIAPNDCLLVKVVNGKAKDIKSLVH